MEWLRAAENCISNKVDILILDNLMMVSSTIRMASSKEGITYMRAASKTAEKKERGAWSRRSRQSETRSKNIDQHSNSKANGTMTASKASLQYTPE